MKKRSRAGLLGVHGVAFCVFSLGLLAACNSDDQGQPPTTQDGPAVRLDMGQGTHGLTKLFFLHHSTGEGLVMEGGMRAAIKAYNSQHGTTFELWDHEYNSQGLRDAAGQLTGSGYEIPNDNTDPDGLHYLWTSQDSDCRTCRDKILQNHEVIAFKSCFPASSIADASELAQRKTWYEAMRKVFDGRKDRLFVVISTPPLHRLDTDATAAKNARLFASWLCSPAYLSGHDNVRCFDLFDALAQPDDGSAAANMLRYAYEEDHTGSDSHPNEAANKAVGPLLARFLIAAALSY